MPLQKIEIKSQNIDEIQSAISERLHFDVEMKVAPSSYFSGEIAMRSGSFFTEIRSCYTDEVEFRSSSPKDYMSVSMLESGGMAINGVSDRYSCRLKETDISIFDPEAIRSLTIHAQSKAIYFQIERDALSRVRVRLTGDVGHLPSVPLQLENAEAGGGRVLATLLTSMAKGFLAREQNVISGFTLRQIEEAALLCLLDLTSSGAGTRQARGGGVGRNTVGTAVELARSSAEPMTVGDLAEALGVTVRALQISFKKELGISPHAYLRQMRLLAVRRDYDSSGRRGLLAIAKHWGFSNSSRFKAEYVSTFGSEAWPSPQGARMSPFPVSSDGVGEGG